MSDPLIHILLGVGVSFFGSLPPGVISLTVMDTAVRKSFRHSLIVAATASCIEFFQSFIAILFSKVLMQNDMISLFIHYGAAPVFLLLSMFFLTKEKLFPKKEAPGAYAATSVAKGLMVGVLNVFVIPFWVFWSSYFAGNKWISLEYGSIAVFSTGITVGTFLALSLYARIGLKMAGKASIMAFWGSKTLGFIFLAFSIYQFIKVFRE